MGKLLKNRNLSVGKQRMSLKNRMKLVRAGVGNSRNPSRDHLTNICTENVMEQIATCSNIGDDHHNVKVLSPAENSSQEIPFRHETSSVMDYHSEPEFMEEIESVTVTEEVVTGRRVVRIGYFFEQIFALGCHEPFSCNISNMSLISEKRNGLDSIFILKCKVCNITQKVYSNEPTDKNMTTNDSAVLACISTGNGYSQMAETHAAMDIPTISNHKYLHISSQISQAIRRSAWDSMKEAGIEEAQLARERGDVDKNGTPLITVVADGAWCKRSYKVNYNASSGVGCIIGYATGKLLFLGIRNKYCTVCSKSDAEAAEPTRHSCFKNWVGTSTSMESDIIVEGFSKSVEIHGVVFKKLIGDGDSSVTKKLSIVKPYGYELVEKIECRNHLLRNFCSKLKELCQKKCSSKNVPVPIILRKCLETNIKRLRAGVTRAIAFRKNEENMTMADKISNVKKDLLNATSHVFGEHLKCVEIGYFCNKTCEENNRIEDLKLCGLYDDVMYCMYRLVHNASSLIMDMDNNAAELYNAVLCKFVGGKRINFALKGSYQTRCEAAGLSYNSRGRYYYNIHKSITNRSPGKHTKAFIARQVKNRLYYSRRKLFKKEIKKKFQKVAEPDEDYGIEEISDLPEEVLLQKKEEFLKTIEKNEEARKDLEMCTRGQSSNPVWKQERSTRLTASSFGKVCKLRPTTSCAKTVESLLYKPFLGNAATRYGIEHEPVAITQFTEVMGLNVQECGLFLHEQYNYLGASPDGIVVDCDSIVEVKCPSVASQMKIKEAIDAKKIQFATMQNNKLFLKKSHNYMYQIQGQLQITKKKFCYFVVWTPLDMKIQKIERDDQFWEEKMAPKLVSFFSNCLLPEIVDPRYTRKMPIRNLRR